MCSLGHPEGWLNQNRFCWIIAKTLQVHSVLLDHSISTLQPGSAEGSLAIHMDIALLVVKAANGSADAYNSDSFSDDSSDGQSGNSSRQYTTLRTSSLASTAAT